MSVFYDIMTAVKTQIDTLSISINGSAVTSVIRKLPKKEQTVDAAAQITISPTQMEPKVTPIAFGNRFAHEYDVEITVISHNDNDQFTNLDTYATIKQNITNLFLLPSSIAVTGVWNIRMLDNDFHDRKFVISGYDYMQLILRVSTIETKY